MILRFLTVVMLVSIAMPIEAYADDCSTTKEQADHIENAFIQPVNELIRGKIAKPEFCANPPKLSVSLLNDSQRVAKFAEHFHGGPGAKEALELSVYFKSLSTRTIALCSALGGKSLSL